MTPTHSDSEGALSRADQKRQVAQLVLGYVGTGLLLGSASFALLGLLLTPWLFIPAGALGIAAGVIFTVRSGLRAAAQLGRSRSGPAHIGMGAEVDASAVIEPGAVIEMGATVKAGARVHSGAVVRMGATVGRDAVIESGAVVGWGATVQEGARVERDASVGAGATVRKGAVLGAGGHLGAGGTLHTHASAPAGAPRVQPEAVDDRQRQLEDVCDRLEAELRGGSPALRSFLSTSEKSVGSLRQTGRDLLARERSLRREVSPEQVARLERERASLKEKLDRADDAQVRASLQHALEAIDAQQAERKLLARNADRLDAELTRLMWSMETVITQLVQVRASGATPSETGLDAGLARIRDELAAVSEAMEAVNVQEREALRRPSAIAPVSVSGNDDAPGGTGPTGRGRIKR